MEPVGALAKFIGGSVKDGSENPFRFAWNAVEVQP